MVKGFFILMNLFFLPSIDFVNSWPKLAYINTVNSQLKSKEFIVIMIISLTLQYPFAQLTIFYAFGIKLKPRKIIIIFLLSLAD